MMRKLIVLLNRMAANPTLSCAPNTVADSFSLGITMDAYHSTMHNSETVRVLVVHL